MVVEWLAAQKVGASQRAATSAVVQGIRPVLHKGKRNVADNAEAEDSYKFKADPLVLREAL